MKLLGMIPIMLVTQLTGSTVKCQKIEDSAYKLADKAMVTNSCELLEQSLVMLLLHAEHCKADREAVRILYNVYDKGCKQS